MTNEQIMSLCKKLQHRGPDRVVINAHGDAVPPKVAKKTHGVESDVIYIRGDSWSLGAPLPLASVAHALWQNDWAARMEKTNSGEWLLRIISAVYD